MAGLAAGGTFRYYHQIRATTSALLTRAAEYEADGRLPQAASFLQRYLLLKPQDRDAYARLVNLHAEMAQTPGDQERLTQMLYRAIGALPERLDFRVRLAENLLQIGEFAAAENEARKLADAQTASEQAAARRVIALAQFARARHRGAVYIQESAQSLIEALDLLPGDIELATAAASLLREHESILAGYIDSPSSRADQFMDRAVALESDDTQALLARYRYRKRYGLADAERDLQRVLELEPRHVEASLLLVAELKQEGDAEGVERARAALERVIDSAPGDPRGYLALARIFINSGQASEAKQVLSRGLAQVGGDEVRLSLALAEVLLDLGSPGKATESLDRADAAITARTATLAKADRLWLEQEQRLLRARAHLAEGREQEADEILRLVGESIAEVDTGARSLQAVRATAMRAQLATQRKDWDRAATCWLSVGQAQPEYAPAHRLAGIALLHAGRAADAVAAFGRYLSLLPAGASTKDIAVELVEAHLAQQLARPIENRDWRDFLAALAAATQEGIASGRLVVAETEYLRYAAEPGWRTAAVDVLRRSESSLPDSQWWGRLPLLYLSLGANADAERALRKYDEFQPPLVPRALTRSQYFAEADDYRAADRELTAAMEHDLDIGQRRELDIERAKLALKSRDMGLAAELAAQLVAKHGQDIEALRIAMEIALARGDSNSAQRWEERLKTVEGPRGTFWRLYRAVRLIEASEQNREPPQEELSKLLEELWRQRPQWPPVLTLTGRYAELQGNSTRAISHYRQALDLGDRRAASFGRLVGLLLAVGRPDDAHDVATLVTRPTLCRQIAALCASRNLPDETEFWLARLVELAPENFDLLARHLAEQGKLDQAVDCCLDRDKSPWRGRAAATLAELLSSTSAEDRPSARKFILEAAQETQGDTRLLLAAAAYLTKLGEPEQATGLFRRIIAQDPQQIVALNNLATLLGDQESTRDEALRHIEKAIAIAGRLPALLDTLGTIHLRDGNHDLARECLEEALAVGDADPRYHFHLAGAYYRLGQLGRARQSLQSALERELTTKPLTTSDRQLLAELQNRLLGMKALRSRNHGANAI